MGRTRRPLGGRVCLSTAPRTVPTDTGPSWRPIVALGHSRHFPLAEVLGLIERAAAQRRARSCTGARGRRHALLVDGASAPARSVTAPGPVEDRHALDVRLIDVCCHLLRFACGRLRVPRRRDAALAGTAAVPASPPIDRARRADRPGVVGGHEAVLPSFDVGPGARRRAPRGSLTLTRLGFRVFTQVDGERDGPPDRPARRGSASWRSRRRCRTSSGRCGAGRRRRRACPRDRPRRRGARSTATGGRARRHRVVRRHAVRRHGRTTPCRPTSCRTRRSWRCRSPTSRSSGWRRRPIPTTWHASGIARGQGRAQRARSGPGACRRAPPRRRSSTEHAEITSDRGELLRLFSGLAGPS